ncbi:hypothetical protein B0A49_04301 [Cryomyces minteri]|uniref:Transcription factor domain-containing protein n=1 Tax=Cryomyces minteri TaxID=331657 RepID=A0A4U0XL28_9PEZI|nr:hypothetical protein B0A49_04301 [Cryomyces minteri]
MAKEEMVQRIKALEQQNADLQGFMEEKDKDQDLWIEFTFLGLMRNERGPVAIQRPQEGHSHQELANWLGRQPLKDIARLSPTLESRLLEVVKEYKRAMNADIAPNKSSLPRWTYVIADEAVTHHLMALYFAWIHPIHMLFSERHFLSSFRNGDRTYCTPSLVNIICAMGCFLIVDQGGSNTDLKCLAPRFVEEVYRDVTAEDPRKPTFAVTYAILFLVELSAGEVRKASSHLRLAAESLIHLDRSNYSTEAFELSSWGIHTLNTGWAGFTYQKPPAPISPQTTVFRHVEMDRPGDCWRSYRFAGDGENRPIALRPSHAIRTAKELAKLNQIVHETVNVYCGSRGKVTARSILHLYERYLQWHEVMPPEIRLDDFDPHALPHVFFLHVNYHVALCRLFRPLLDYRDFTRSTHEHIKSIVVQNARDGINLLERYRCLFSNRRQPPLQAFCLVHLSESFIRTCADNSECQQLILFCLEMLRDVLPGFLFVGPIQAMFCQTVLDFGCLLPKNVSELMGGRTHYAPEEMLDACGTTTCTQPVDVLLDLLDPSIAQNFEVEWKKFIEGCDALIVDEGGAPNKSSSEELSRGESPPSNRSMQINALINL